MSTLNLDLPVSDTLATRWQSLSDEERQRWEVRVSETLAELEEEYDVRAAIAEGIADADAGRYITFEAYLEQERAAFREKGLDFDAELAKTKPVVDK